MAVNLINSMLKNDGITVDHNVSPSHQLQGSFKAVHQLVEEMKSGKVDVLIINKINPAYSLPDSVGFQEALKKVRTVIYIGTENNETARLADYVLADHHDLEKWSDSEPQKNVFSIQQPAIRPLFQTRSFQESVLIWGKITLQINLKILKIGIPTFKKIGNLRFINPTI